MAGLWIYILCLLEFASYGTFLTRRPNAWLNPRCTTSVAYEPSLFGTYSKKIGMWLFLLSIR